LETLQKEGVKATVRPRQRYAVTTAMPLSGAKLRASQY
jgi:hypothetical protein